MTKQPCLVKRWIVIMSIEVDAETESQALAIAGTKVLANPEELTFVEAEELPEGV